MPVSKVIYGNDTVIDLTQDTITADRLGAGYTAHGANGEAITGTGLLYTEGADITPIEFDYNRGYIYEYNLEERSIEMGYFDQEPTQCYLDIYEITAGKYYSLSLDSVVGSRFRVGMAKTYLTFMDNIQGRSAAKLQPVFYLNDTPVANQKVFFSNNLGDYSYTYLIVQKSNTGQTGLITHLREVTF